MTQIVTTTERARAIFLASTVVGLPSPFFGLEGPPGTMTITYQPDLTAQQQADLDRLQKIANGAALMSPAEYAALEPRFGTGRAFLQVNQATFRGLTENAMRDMVLDNVSAIWRVLFRLLRDP